MTTNRVRACVAAGVSFAILAGAGSSAWAQEKPAGAPTQTQTRGAQPRGAGGDASSVEAAMKGMGRALRGLRDSIADSAKRDQNLAAIGEMQKNCVAAKGMPLPASVHKEITDPAERAKLATAYRADLMKVLTELLALEKSVMDGDGASATKQLDAILASRDAGHKAMGVDD